MKKLTSQFICLFVFVAVLSIQAFSQKNPQLSDPEVASVAVVANRIDIAYAAIAKEKSKDKEILKFAETMTADHNAVLAQQ